MVKVLKKIKLSVFAIAITNAVAMAQTTNVYLPNGCLVGAYLQESESRPTHDIAWWQNQIEIEYPHITLATVIGVASSTYNCHGYAWHMYNEADPAYISNPVWMSDLHWLFLTSVCYAETITPVYPGKVVYENANHSAVTTNVPDEFISKWGWNPLVRHHKDHCPYDDYTSLTYYKQNFDLISGLSTIMGSSIYTITACQTPTWDITNKQVFSITTNPNGSATVTANAFNGAKAQITASFNGKVFAKKDIQAGNPPPTPFVSGPKYVCTSGIVYSLQNPPSGSISWSVTGPFTLVAVPYKPAEITVSRTGSSTGSGTLKATVGGVSYTLPIEASCAISISSPDIVCYSPGATFTVSGAPNGFTWDKSTHLTITGSGNSVTISKTNPDTYSYYGTGEGWVSIKNNGEELVRKNVWVGTPLLYVTPTESAVTPWSYKTFYANITNNMSAPSQYEWILNKAGQLTYYNIVYNSKEFYFSDPVNYQVHCHAYNTCGYGEYDIIDLTAGYSPSPPISYPNPASDVLNIEIDTESTAQTAGGMNSKTVPVYDIRLYDGQGNLLRQTTSKGGTTQFNVANLPAGIYYLHVYDGINDKPEISQIIVEH